MSRRKDLTNPGYSPRGLKTRNPGYIPGDHWISCSVCGGDFRVSDSKLTWDNRVVCKQDWEPRHEQDFVRAVYEDTAAKGLVRPEDPDIFLDVYCTDNTSVAGDAEAGCAVAGATSGRIFTSSIPSATFTNGL